MKRNYLYLFIASFFLLGLTGCSDKVMGYSVVLWNVPEHQIKSGEVVPVYIKSNISHVYVVGNHDGEKIEIPLWQLTEPVKKNKIKTLESKYEANAHTYASVKADGLPARAEPVNTAKQVYRCRKGEVIKILYKGKGQAPMTGGKPLEGDWYRILTDNGTLGWCFSYNLNLYESSGDDITSGVLEEVQEEEVDRAYGIITSRTWYPDYYRTMIDSNNIDLTKFHSSYKFTIDETNKKVSLNLANIHQTWDYDGYSKTAERQYKLKDIPIIVVYKNAEYIVLRYTDESGKPQDLNFVTISEDLDEIVKNEKDRRTNEYLQVWGHGPVYESSSYGKIVLNEDGTFRWTNFRLLVPSVIAAGAKNVGTASVKYSLSKKLAESYDGVVSFKFDNMTEEVNFLYKFEDGGVRMEDTIGAQFNGNQLTSRGSSPVIIYFKTIH